MMKKTNKRILRKLKHCFHVALTIFAVCLMAPYFAKLCAGEPCGLLLDILMAIGASIIAAEIVVLFEYIIQTRGKARALKAALLEYGQAVCEVVRFYLGFINILMGRNDFDMERLAKIILWISDRMSHIRDDDTRDAIALFNEIQNNGELLNRFEEHRDKIIELNENLEIITPLLIANDLITDKNLQILTSVFNVWGHCLNEIKSEDISYRTHEIIELGRGLVALTDNDEQPLILLGLNFIRVSVQNDSITFTYVDKD